MFLLKNLILPIGNHKDLRNAIAQKLHIPSQRIQHWEILLRSLDARQKNHLRYNYTILLNLDGKAFKHPDVLPYNEPQDSLLETAVLQNQHPFIIGTGPAGIFSALALVEQGFQPWLFDRGDALEERTRLVNSFWQNGNLDPESNVQFGAGGAGTFSDGKLTARNRGSLSKQVFDLLVRFGADPDIRINALPHIGTDGLKQILANIFAYLEDKGGVFHWRSALQDIQIENGNIKSVTINGKRYEPEILILALGNAARDTFRMLHSQNVALESKPFAVGFRIEHEQDFLNESLYGERTDINISGPASYRLTANCESRGVYSFCMCPGGQVIASASEPGMNVTNGMSNARRDGRFGNSAIVTSVDANDYGTGILAGMEFQQKLETQAYLAGYFAPIQKAGDFCAGKKTPSKLHTTYLPGVQNADLTTLFPSQVTLALQSGLKQFDKRIPGFIKNGVLIAPETRTSSPIRIVRTRETGASLNVSNLYPIGEGSGYAGGIISSAVDGYKLGLRFHKAKG